METLTSIANQLGRLSIGWLDFLAVILVLLGVHMGNRTGASKQIISFSVWVVVLAAAAIGYRHLAPLFERFLGTSPRFAPALAYGFIAVWVAVVLTLITKGFADRVEATTAFGRAEYVLGPAACMIRNLAVFCVIIGVIHGIQVIPEHEKKYREEQMKVYGMILYPTSGIVRDTVFGGSMAGRLAHDHLEFLLAKPNYTPPPPSASFAAR